ncbi:hypothetical protein AMAG_13585 [Allomyces macrogynus ATCC 38327]|uniref:Uncharacterized protein n=1 Tax=Allomyces macrogynus (strain ATCC 38327) TaxID=578462 RepID=A0A0L0T2V8_ALLM3|nr:hypothetical protein AMAG_13585 [Allomyces macrogynus ATCC 38327]|eukprot:KNE69193.1 hypothetical protein AMAG_13585 [Allomyces macrogynus ATCC 38327]
MGLDRRAQSRTGANPSAIARQSSEASFDVDEDCGEDYDKEGDQFDDNLYDDPQARVLHQFIANHAWVPAAPRSDATAEQTHKYRTVHPVDLGSPYDSKEPFSARTSESCLSVASSTAGSRPPRRGRLFSVSRPAIGTPISFSSSFSFPVVEADPEDGLAVPAPAPTATAENEGRRRRRKSMTLAERASTRSQPTRSSSEDGTATASLQRRKSCPGIAKPITTTLATARTLVPDTADPSTGANKSPHADPVTPSPVRRTALGVPLLPFSTPADLPDAPARVVQRIVVSPADADGVRTSWLPPAVATSVAKMMASSRTFRAFTPLVTQPAGGRAPTTHAHVYTSVITHEPNTGEYRTVYVHAARSNAVERVGNGMEGRAEWGKRLDSLVGKVKWPTREGARPRERKSSEQGA